MASARWLLARCPSCDQQHRYGSKKQLERVQQRGFCKLCQPSPPAS